MSGRVLVTTAVGGADDRSEVLVDVLEGVLLDVVEGCTGASLLVEDGTTGASLLVLEGAADDDGGGAEDDSTGAGEGDSDDGEGWGASVVGAGLDGVGSGGGGASDDAGGGTGSECDWTGPTMPVFVGPTPGMVMVKAAMMDDSRDWSVSGRWKQRWRASRGVRSRNRATGQPRTHDRVLLRDTRFDPRQARCIDKKA